MPTGLEHAGDISPSDALDMVNGPDKAVLIDVRTQSEWDDVGVPDLGSAPRAPIFVELLTAPAMLPNPDFTKTLVAELAARGAEPDTPLVFLCRSGARSTAAARAMTALGYTRSYNIAGGFEGSAPMGLPGWRRSGLPSSGD